MNTFAIALLATSVLAISLESSTEYGLEAHEFRDQPGDLCCRFFKETNFVDPHEHEYCITDPSGFNNYTIGDGTRQEPIQSAMCGKNVAVDVCDDPPEMTGDRYCPLMSAGSLTTVRVYDGYNYPTRKWISMEYYNPAIQGAVTTFNGSSCDFLSNRYFEQPEQPEGTFYSLAANGFTTIQTVQVPYGYTLITYTQDYGSDYEYEMERIIGDYEDPVLQTPKCQNLVYPATWTSGHEIVGLKVVRNRNAQNPDPAVGFWKSLLVSTESQEFEYHIGLSNSQSTGSSMENAASVESSTEVAMEYTTEEYMERAIQNGIAASVEVGGAFKMFSFGASSEVERTETDTYGSSQSSSYGAAWGASQGVSSLVAQDAQVSMQEDYGFVHKTTCTTEGATGAGLYQFVYMTPDGKASLHTPHIVCRTGEHWNTPPACTWDACKNADCTCCEGDPGC